jgi:hypothetical protein
MAMNTQEERANEPARGGEAESAIPPRQVAHRWTRTKSRKVWVTVMESSDGRPRLLFGLGHLPSMPRVYFGLDLAPETTLERARWLARTINWWAVRQHAVIFEPEAADGANPQGAGGVRRVAVRPEHPGQSSA